MFVKGWPLIDVEDGTFAASFVEAVLLSSSSIPLHGLQVLEKETHCFLETAEPKLLLL